MRQYIIQRNNAIPEPFLYRLRLARVPLDHAPVDFSAPTHSIAQLKTGEITMKGSE